MKELYFRFGALSPKISEQYKEQGYELKNGEKWDKIVHCAVMLHIHNILTDSRYDEALNRIIKFSKEEIMPIEVEE